MSRPDVCIYHGNCADGFTSAWAVWKKWGNAVKFFPGVYGEEPPDVTDQDVLIVDFSYKRPVLEEMAKSASSITILDHHKAAEADLAAFTSIDGVLIPAAQLVEQAQFMHTHPIQARFRMDMSGAALTWAYCFPDEPQPWIVRYVQDRDLWRFELTGSREVAASLFSYPYDFEIWDIFALRLDEGVSSTLAVIAEGAAIERKHHKDIAELLAISTRYMTIGGYLVKVANLPYTMSSDAAGALAKGQAFGACYFDRADARIFSLRSAPDGIDVSEIAAAYGGGGHKHASGFQVPIGWEGEK